MKKSRRATSWETQTARKLRKDMTGPERVLWKLLRDRSLAHLKFRRQVPIGRFIVDFFCHSASLVLELDGESHADRGEYDLERQKLIELEGYRVLRISNDDVLKEPEAVVLGIIKATDISLRDVDDRFGGGRAG
ncbi:endonuclease domain-containing protein [Calycomorphotria hydatis]|uniref:DUF559 domain-containing protein n=1 Tax=Calycomorphotria hydatis TaxID=2528027 RepID=A0A517T743_9PLAN|nr:DUF559 domain-containing protein [Calycomorphotria hydatis]QDT64195.1 hypothetical protein V22_14260 [Calycomorphotria hydatis]